MKKSKILISAVTMFSLCITPMSAYAQVDPNSKVGLLYEKYDSWSRNELHLKNILKYEKFTIDELKVQP